MVVWSLRYLVNVSLDHLPIILMTSKDIPCSKYSSIPPIRSPWPFNSGRFAVIAIDADLFTTSFFDSGCSPLACFQAKRCAFPSA